MDEKISLCFEIMDEKYVFVLKRSMKNRSLFSNDRLKPKMSDIPDCSVSPND